MDMILAVSYVPYDTSSREQTGDIITFAQFEEGRLLSKNCDDTKSDNKSDDNSTLEPLISEEEMDVMSSGDESDSEPISTAMLEDICDGSQSHPSINRREARYKMRHRIKGGKAEWKGALLSTRNMGKGLHKLFKAVVNEISQALPILGESGSEFSYFILEPINSAEVAILSENIKKHCLKAALK